MGYAIYISIIGCTTYIGFALASYYAKRERLYNDLCKMCESFKSGIGFMLMPLRTVLCGIKEYSGQIATSIITELDNILQSGSPVTQQRLQDSLKLQGYLSPEELQLICGFFAQLGKSDSRLQINLIETYALRFNEMRLQCAAEYKKTAPMYRKLGFLSGLIICLFLI